MVLAEKLTSKVGRKNALTTFSSLIISFRSHDREKKIHQRKRKRKKKRGREKDLRII